MKTYLVDFENVKSKGLNGIDKLTEDDHVIIFYSENSDTISFEMHCMVMRAKAQVDYMKVKVGGKNALDFQLSTLLGYLVAKEENTHIFVISNDKGFDKLHDFWENTFSDSPNCAVFRTQNISAAINYARHNKKTGMPIPVATVEDEETDTAEEYIEEVSVDEDEVIGEVEADNLSAAVVSNDEATLQQAPKNDKPVESKVIEFEIKSKNQKIMISDEPDPVEEEILAFAGETRIIDGVPTVIGGEKFDRTQRKSNSKYSRRIRNPQEYDFPVTIISHEEDPLKGVNLKQDSNAIPITRNNYPLELCIQSDVERFEPRFKEYLSTPEAQDKHKLLKAFMPEVSDEDIEKTREAILQSDCKLILHNLLMKEFDNDTSSKYYNMVKKHYFFFKRVLPVTDENAKSEENTDKNIDELIELEKKLDTVEPIEFKPDTKPATEGTPKKVDAAMKKQLHAILDDIATQDEFSGVVAQINQSATLQQLYINLMQRFKKDRGRELYKAVKSDFADFVGCKKRFGKDTTQQNSQKNFEYDTVDGGIRALTAGIIADERIDEIRSIIESSSTVHELYLSVVKHFGRNPGLKIYKAIKDDFPKLLELWQTENTPNSAPDPVPENGGEPQ